MAYEPRKNPPPRAFKGSLEDKLQAHIHAIAQKLYRLAKPKFTGQELGLLFVPTQYRQMMHGAFALSHGADSHHNIFVRTASWSPDVPCRGTLNFEWYFSTAPDAFYPLRTWGATVEAPCTGPHDDAPADVREKFVETIRRMIHVSYEWGLVLRVFNELNQPSFCSTPAQMRYVWPPILQLLNGLELDAVDRRLITTLQHESMRAGDRARIPLPIQPYIRQTYDIVTRSIFLRDHEPNDETHGGITYKLRNMSFDLPGLSFEGIATSD